MFKTFLIALVLVAFTGVANAQSQSLSVSLSFSDNSSNEDGFTIERKVGAGAYAPLINLAANTTTHQDNIVSDPGNTTYCYQVKAFNAAGVSAPSNEACATSPAILTIPVPASGL